MKLPYHEQAFVPREEITDYLLSFGHRAGRSKADFFSRFRFVAEAWEVLASALLTHAAAHELMRVEDSFFGKGI